MKRNNLTIVGLAALVLFFAAGSGDASAATLRLSPDTGVYSAGSNFSARVIVNTQGKPINAAEGEITFNTNDLSVVSISKAGSIFTLWTREPEFSNATGKISFGGGSPSGYTGSAGTVMTVTFRTKHEGATNVVYGSGSVLAADGMGTNVLSNMQGASYTVQAVTNVPAPEYVPPANTPGAPLVRSSSHPDPTKWYTEKTAELSWDVPQGVIAIRTLLDTKESTVPTKVYEEPIEKVSIPDLDEGTSYFHIQYKNADGWGRVTHYRIAVDTEKPESFEITPAEGNNAANPEQKFVFKLKDASSGVGYYMVQIDGGERVRFDDAEHIGLYTTPQLEPGAHTMVVEAFDKSGNSIVTSTNFDVEAFDAPVFTEYPRELSSDVIPVIRGTTRPLATVMVSVHPQGAVDTTYEVTADDAGTFTFIPENRFADGVYELSAVATDAYGAKSSPSETIRIAVQKPGLVRIGGYVVSVLSVVVPLAALIALLVGILWYSWHRMAVVRRRLRKEIREAEQSLAHEMHAVVTAVTEDIEELKKVRKGRLTKQEEKLVESLTTNLATAERRVRKEIEDIEKLTKG